jgi:hypothetical protein
MPFPKREKERAGMRFEMRLCEAERTELREAADLAGISVSELVRKRALGRPVHSAADLMLVRELRRLGGLQKHAINKLIDKREVAQECISTIKALREAVERVARDDC